MRDKSFLAFGQLHSVAEDLSSRAIRVAQFLVGQLNFGQSVRIARFFRFRFLLVALRIRAYTDLLQDFGETQIFGKRLGSRSKFSVPKSVKPFQ